MKRLHTEFLLTAVLAAAPLLTVPVLLCSCGKGGDSVAGNGAPRTYTYRTTSAAVSTWSPTDWEMTAEKVPLDYTCDSLYEYDLNDSRDDYVINTSMAAEMPVDVTVQYAGNKKYGVPADATEGFAWQVKLRNGLYWDNGTRINADSFVYSLQQFLNPKMKNYRANTFYQDSMIIAGAEEYYNGTGSWDDVGFIKNDDLTFTVVLKRALTPFMFIYNSGSFILLREDLYEANKQQSGDIVKSAYGTAVENYASYGPYKIVEYQPDKSMRLTRNEAWHGYHDKTLEGQYQTSDIYVQYIVEHSTIISLFLQGKLDDTALDAKDLEKYASSEYRIINPLSYTWRYSFNTDKASLKKENMGNENHLAISNVNFLHGISLSLDRQKYCDTIGIGSNPAFGLLNYSYVADPDTNTKYRDTKSARQMLCDLYGTKDVADITGYNLDEARTYFQKAWKELSASGDVKAGDTFVIDYHTYNSSDINVKSVAFLQEAIDAGSAGTPFEGRVTVKQVIDQDYYNNMQKGNVDVAMCGWGGSSFDPYSSLWGYCTAEAKNEYGLDINQKFSILLDGKNVTKSFNEWYNALCNGEYSAAEPDVRNTILAGVEKALLATYNMIPMRDYNANAMLSQRIVEGADSYINDLVQRGGVQYRTYTMDDAEWEDYCAKNNYQLQY